MTTKDNGVYYTPDSLAFFIVEHALRAFNKERELSILEPSCGDGVFIDALTNCLYQYGNGKHSIDCVEIDGQALELARARPHNEFKKCEFINSDFFDFSSHGNKKYDLIVGNPPYVVRKRLPTNTIEKCKNVYSEAGLNDQDFRNLWGSFLIQSTSMLAKDGVLAFVLPAELLQVKYSEELRNFLLNSYDRVEVISFDDIIFDDIEQDTILLIGYKHHLDKGLFSTSRKNLAKLLKDKPKFKKKPIGTHSFKWTSHVLTHKELNLLVRLEKKFSPISHYCTAVAGIVTAANDFFIVNDTTLKQYDLEGFALPIIQKGMYVNGSATFTEDAFEKIRESGKACHLLDFSRVNGDEFSTQVQQYLELGEKLKIDQRYKCRKRSPWYHVPGIWKSDGLFFKRSHLYPKILENSSDAVATDSAYRITMLDGFNIHSLVHSFYNSLTLSLAELKGRFYGGGVLELTPNEFKSIPIPYTEIALSEFEEFTDRFEHKTSIDDFVVKSDHEILNKVFNINSDDINTLQTIRKKLTSRRLS